MIHAVKEFLDIALQDEAVSGTVTAHTAGFAFQNIHTFMRTEPDPAGKRCLNKRLLKNWVQDGKYRVMQNAVADFGLMNMSLLGIGNIKTVVAPMAVGFVFQIPMELEKVLFDMPFKFNNIRLVFLVGFECFPCCEKILYRDYFSKKVAISFH